MRIDQHGGVTELSRDVRGRQRLHHADEQARRAAPPDLVEASDDRRVEGLEPEADPDVVLHQVRPGR